MNASGFASAFAPQLEDYLAFKENMGFYGASRIWYLQQFDAYCTAHERTVFDRDTVEGWVTQQLTRSGLYRSWMSYIRDVGRWLQAHGRRDAYVLSDRWKAAVVPAHPYLLTRDEIEVFFAAAATLNAVSPWRWQAVAFFTLMHSCGLRTGETSWSMRIASNDVSTTLLHALDNPRRHRHPHRLCQQASNHWDQIWTPPRNQTPPSDLATCGS